MTYAIAVADAHLDNLDQELAHFLSFLESIQKSHPHTFYILGDLFNFWVGTPKMQLPYQVPVIKALQTLRDNGMLVKYVEGNRDYFLSPLYWKAPFSDIASEQMQERIGNLRVYLAHGDLVNVHDRPYRLWRRISRNRMIYTGFKCLPRSVALRVAHFFEHTFRGTNRKNKSAFPVKTCETYARNLLQTGYDAVILGHFHEERRQEFSLNGQKKYLYVLPAWRETHTYLQISDQGACSFRKFSINT